MTATRKPNKRVTQIGPRQGLAIEDFHAHWSGPHAAIARDLPGLHYYVQNHVLRPLWQSRQTDSGIHGFAETAFRDPDGIFDAIDSWSRIEELKADEARFLNERATSWSIVDEPPPDVSPRRIIFTSYRGSADGAPVAAESVSEAVAEINEHLPCHAEKAVNDGPSRIFPDWLIYVEVPLTADVAHWLSPTGPVLTPLVALEGEGDAYLVYAEVKQLPVDFD